MALELENEIMREIGLGNHPNWYQGSSSCEFRRMQAAEKLPKVIRKYHDKKDPKKDSIAEPNAWLCGLVTAVAQSGDKTRITLQNTWEAASHVIAEHIHVADLDEASRQRNYQRLADYITQTYLSNQSEEVPRRI